jgi:hypothetical protein
MEALEGTREDSALPCGDEAWGEGAIEEYPES